MARVAVLEPDDNPQPAAFPRRRRREALLPT